MKRAARVALALLAFLLFAKAAWAAPERDYRSRTIYFVVADRFHAPEPFAPFVDPEHPFATNTRDCFVEACTLERSGGGTGAAASRA